MKIQEQVVMDRTRSAYISKAGKIEVFDATASPDEANLQQLGAQLKEMYKKPVLINAVDATHYGFVNSNHAFYMPEYLEANAKTFTVPYRKAVTVNHSDDQQDVIGRIHKAIPVKYQVNAKDKESTKKPKGHITVYSAITNPEAIQKIIDETYLTTSIRARGIPEDIKCSICGKNPVMDEECSHQRGQIYDTENGKEACFYKVGRQVYKEYSFVTHPADEGAINKQHIMINDNDADTTWGPMDYTHGELLSDLNSLFSYYVGDSSNPASTSVINLKGENIELKDFMIEDTKCIGDICPVANPGTVSGTSTSDNSNSNQASVNDGSQTEKDCGCIDKLLRDYATLSILESMIKDGSLSDPESIIDELGNVPSFNFGDIKAEEMKDSKALLSYVTDKLDELEDSKLPTKKRASLPESTFCGPGRTFPVTDSAQVTAARRLVGKSSYSPATKASILSSVNGKAKHLECDAKDEAELKNAQAGTAGSIPQTTMEAEQMFNFQTKDELLGSSIVTTHVGKIEADYQEKVSKLQAQVADLEKEVKTTIIDKIVDSTIKAKLSKAKAFLEATDSAGKEKAAATMKDEYKDCDFASLKVILSFVEGEAKDVKVDTVTEKLAAQVDTASLPVAPAAAPAPATSEVKDSKTAPASANEAAAAATTGDVNNPAAPGTETKDADKPGVLNLITRKRK